MRTVSLLSPARLGDDIETVLCLAVLMANGEVPADNRATHYDVDEYFARLQDDCEHCPYNPRCLACIINE